MLVRASAASCRVVESATAAASSSLSARRDNERASRNNAATTFADGGSGTSESVTAPILDCPPLPDRGRTPRSNPAPSPRVSRARPTRPARRRPTASGFARGSPGRPSTPAATPAGRDRGRRTPRRSGRLPARRRQPPSEPANDGRAGASPRSGWLAGLVGEVDAAVFDLERDGADGRAAQRAGQPRPARTGARRTHPTPPVHPERSTLVP